jgi:hypothetical protein
MSMSPDSSGADRLVNLLSRWLARHADDDELRFGLDEFGGDGLGPGERAAVDELRQALVDEVHGGDLEMHVRETLQALAMGV